MASVPDISRHGLSLVYKPPSASGRAVAHIIFVHGLFGDPQATWTGRKPKVSPASTTSGSATHANTRNAGQGAVTKSKGVFWPYELLRTAIPNVNIHTWGYDADIDGFWSSASQNTVAQHAANLTSDLADLLESDGTEPLPIIFVVHSLGGLVVKAALNQSAATRGTRLSVVVNNVRGVMFLGTPHRGSRSASIGKHAYRITTIATRRPNTTLLRALERNSEALDGIGSTFLQTLAGHKIIQIYSFREEKEMRKFLFFNQIIVESDSAQIGLPEEEVSSIPESHSNMTKFSSASDVGFKRVVAQLKRWVKKIEDENSVTIDDCLRSLESPDTQTRLNSVAPSHAKTFHWLYEPQKVSFSTWLEHPGELGSIYWIQGKPGSGKSTLMKFAMLDHRTRIALQKHGTLKWIVAGYFFHNRGTLIQKSIQGMLQALLYAILCQSHGLRDIIQPVYMKLVSRQRTKSVVWDFDALQSAFQMIVQQRTVRIRLCLFLDALDEHHGDNDRLSDMMHDLAATVDNDIVQLRLCLASRSWDTFLNNFGNCPGFKIHDYTLKDIESYTSSHLHNALSKLTNEGKPMEAKLRRIDGLADKISKRAQGVFIWVRIVVELIAAAIRSRTPLVALDALLDDMPEELADLYLHTLERIEPTHAEESYVMLQLARCALTPLNLETFVNTTSWNLWEKIPEHGEETIDDMVQRVTSRSGGLLEVIEVFISDTTSNVDIESDTSDASNPHTNGAIINAAHTLDDVQALVNPRRTKFYIIQFCHQTVKEFIQSAPVNFGLRRTSETGNGYEYLLTAAHPGYQTWGKHMANEALEYAVFACKDSPPMALDDARRSLTVLFGNMGLESVLRQKNLAFYAEQELGSVDDIVQCLMFSSGLLEVVMEPSQNNSSSAYDRGMLHRYDADQAKRRLWLTALIGPRATSHKPSRKDMLQALWDRDESQDRPISDSAYFLYFEWYIAGRSAPYQFHALEILILDRLLQLGGTDGLPAIEFLLSHGVSPNTGWSVSGTDLLRSSGIYNPTIIDVFASDRIFVTVIRLDSAPLTRLFGEYGAEVPQVYWEPLRKIQAVIRSSSDVFTEVMRIVDRQEKALRGREEPPEDEMSAKVYFPAAPLRDDVQLGLLFPGILGGMAIANGRMLRSRRAISSSWYVVVRVIMLIFRWRRRMRGR